MNSIMKDAKLASTMDEETATRIIKNAILNWVRRYYKKNVNAYYSDTPLYYRCRHDINELCNKRIPRKFGNKHVDRCLPFRRYYGMDFYYFDYCQEHVPKCFITGKCEYEMCYACYKNSCNLCMLGHTDDCS